MAADDPIDIQVKLEGDDEVTSKIDSMGEKGASAFQTLGSAVEAVAETFSTAVGAIQGVGDAFLEVGSKVVLAVQTTKQLQDQMLTTEQATEAAKIAMKAFSEESGGVAQQMQAAHDAVQKYVEQVHKAGEESEKSAGHAKSLSEALGQLAKDAESGHLNMQTLIKDLIDIAKSFGPIGQGVGIIAGVGVAVFELAQKAGEAAQAMHLAAVSTGLTIDQFQHLQEVSAETGIPMSNLERALRQVESAAGAAAAAGEQSSGKFKKFGDTLVDVNGDALSSAEAMTVIQTHFNSLGTTAEKTAYILGEFGNRIGGPLVEAFNKNEFAAGRVNGELDKIAHTSHQLDEEARELHNSIEALGLSFSRLQETFGAAAAKYFTDAIKTLTAACEELRPVAAAVGRVLGLEFGTVLKALADGLKTTADEIKFCAEMFIAFFTAVTVVIQILAQMAEAIAHLDFKKAGEAARSMGAQISGAVNKALDDFEKLGQGGEKAGEGIDKGSKTGQASLHELTRATAEAKFKSGEFIDFIRNDGTTASDEWKTKNEKAADALGKVAGASATASGESKKVAENAKAAGDGFEHMATGVKKAGDEAAPALDKIVTAITRLSQTNFGRIIEDINNIIVILSNLEASAATTTGALEKIGGANVTQPLLTGFTNILDLLDNITKAAGVAADALDKVGGSGGGGKFAEAAPTGGFASGGMVHGPGSGTSDSIMARLSNGEFVMKAQAVQAWGRDFMQSINSMQGLPGFAEGGYVSTARVARPSGDKAGPGSVLNLTIDGQHFAGLHAPEHVAEKLSRFAISRQLTSAGRQPSWVR